MRLDGIKAFGLAALILSMVLLSAGCVTTGQTAQDGALTRARSGIEKGDYDFALMRLAAAESYVETGPERKAEILYLRAVCFEGLNQTSTAEALFKEASEKYGETEYGQKSKLKLPQKTR